MPTIAPVSVPAAPANSGRTFAKDLAAGTAIAQVEGFAENYGHTSFLPAGQGRLPYAQDFPDALWQKQVQDPFSKVIEAHPALKAIPFLAGYPYWATLVVAPALIPLAISAWHAHQQGESLKPFAADAAVTAVSTMTVEDAGYWEANPAFGGATSFLGHPYFSAVPQDGWLSGIPVVGKILGQDLPFVPIPVAYAVTAAGVGAYLAWRLHEHHADGPPK